MRWFFALHLLVLSAAFLRAQSAPQPPPASATEAMHQAAVASAERKFQHIEDNSRQAQPDQRPTVLTEREINAYLASGKMELPKGVRSVRFTGTPGAVHALARVDFDTITAEKRSSNPLLALFTGVHDVEVRGRANGSGGQGQVRIESVAIDGVTVPRIALQFFIDRYLKPKHPEIGLDSTFRLPYRIDIAQIGSHNLTVTQK
ncbi:MAG: hypothetical protein ACE14L_04525 [Terriglobales bacterium]